MPYKPLFGSDGQLQQAPAAAPAPAQQPAPQTGGYVPLFPEKPMQAQTQTGGDQNAAPAQGWGVNLPSGDITMPQSVKDWGNVAGNEAMAGTIPGLRAQAEAARQRLGPAAAGSADIAGNTVSPTSLLTLLGQPELAGGLHEGIKSYMSQPDWLPSSAGWKQIGEDTAAGAATGGFGRGLTAFAPQVVPPLVKQAVKAGPAGYATKLIHDQFGSVGGDIASALGVYGGLDKMGEWAEKGSEKLLSSPVTKQILQNLILSGGSAARTAAGPWDQLGRTGP